MVDTEKKQLWYKKRTIQIPLAILIVMFIFSIFIMSINYSFPNFFVMSPQQENANLPNIMKDNVRQSITIQEPTKWKKGLMTANTLVYISENISSNWLPNDKVWPTIFLDNPQNYQLGQLEMLTYTTRVMRDHISRLRDNDKIDDDLRMAFSLLSNDPFKWMMPSAESRYKKATDHLKSYRDRLASEGEGLFYPRSDSLQEFLRVLAKE